MIQVFNVAVTPRGRNRDAIVVYTVQQRDLCPNTSRR